MMINYLDKSRFLHRAVCLIDSEHGIKKTDEMLFDLIEKKKKPWLLVFTKIDKLKREKMDLLEESAKKIFPKYQFMSPIVHLTSTK